MIKILKNFKNELLNREEIIMELEQNVTPSKQEVTKKLSDELKKPGENIVIEKINSKFGSKKFIIFAKSYNNAEEKAKYETIPKKVKKKTAEEAKKTSEEAKAEKKSEKVKEEPKQES